MLHSPDDATSFTAVLAVTDEIRSCPFTQPSISCLVIDILWSKQPIPSCWFSTIKSHSYWQKDLKLCGMVGKIFPAFCCAAFH